MFEVADWRLLVAVGKQYGQMNAIAGFPVKYVPDPLTDVTSLFLLVWNQPACILGVLHERLKLQLCRGLFNLFH